MVKQKGYLIAEAVKYLSIASKYTSELNAKIEENIFIHLESCISFYKEEGNTPCMPTDRLNSSEYLKPKKA